MAAIEISKYDPLYDKIAQHQRQVKLPRTRSCPDLGSFDFTANGHEDPYSGDPMDLARNKLQEMVRVNDSWFQLSQCECKCYQQLHALDSSPTFPEMLYTIKCYACT